MQVKNYKFRIKLWARRLLLSLSVIFMTVGYTAQVDISYQIKASYIYNILQLVSFPNNAFHAPGVLNVCILGEDRFGEALNEIDGARTPQGELNVIRLGAYSEEKSFDDCNALYIVETEIRFIESVLTKINTKKILAIGEFAPFIRYGGLIELFAQDDRIRFKINEKLVKETDFKVANQLIQLGSGADKGEGRRTIPTNIPVAESASHKKEIM